MTTRVVAQSTTVRTDASALTASFNGLPLILTAMSDRKKDEGDITH